MELKNKVIEQLNGEKNVFKIESFRDILNYQTKNISDLSIKEMISRNLEWMIGKRFFANHQERLILYLKEVNVDKILKIKTIVNSVCELKECWIAGDLVTYADFSKKIPQVLLESFLSSFIMVAMVIMWLMIAHDLPHKIVTVLCSLWSPIAMVLIIFLLHVKINFLTCVFASVLVGLTGDNAIQFIFGSKTKLSEGMEDRGLASLLLTGLMVLSCSIFLGSYFVPPRIFGCLLGAGFIFSLIGDLWMLRSLTQNSPSKEP